MYAARTFKVTLAYAGTRYAGWQIQPGKLTVQGVLEEAVEQITGKHTDVVASGRTDSGVHALGQVCSFACETRLAPDVLVRALDANTPRDIAIRQVQEMPRGFHALRDAIRKQYRYLLTEGPDRDVFAAAWAWQLSGRLDLEALRQAAQSLTGQHDFASFETSGSPRVTTVRTVQELAIRRETGCLAPRIVLEITADGFLYNMVRNIVGTLVEIGRGERPVAWISDVLTRRDRRAAGPTAPAHGLYLVRVDYPEMASQPTPAAADSVGAESVAQPPISSDSSPAR